MHIKKHNKWYPRPVSKVTRRIRVTTTHIDSTESDPTSAGVEGGVEKEENRLTIGAANGKEEERNQ